MCVLRSQRAARHHSRQRQHASRKERIRLRLHAVPQPPTASPPARPLTRSAIDVSWISPPRPVHMTLQHPRRLPILYHRPPCADSFAFASGHLSPPSGVYGLSHWESPAGSRGGLPASRAWLFPTPRMCYKRASEGLLEMGQPEAVVPKAQAAQPEVNNRGRNRSLRSTARDVRLGWSSAVAK